MRPNNERAPGGRSWDSHQRSGRPRSTKDNTNPTCCPTCGKPTGEPVYQYRVRYQRDGWTHDQSRFYNRADDAIKFFDKLRDDRRDKYADLEFVEIHRRQVIGRWDQWIRREKGGRQ